MIISSFEKLGQMVADSIPTTNSAKKIQTLTPAIPTQYA